MAEAMDKVPRAMTEAIERTPRKCKFAEVIRCTGSHPPWRRRTFGDKTPEERSKIILDNKLCLFCLLHGTEEVCFSKTYKTKLVYHIPKCEELHIEWLHHVMQPLKCKK
jgi:hypothetical protein